MTIYRRVFKGITERGQTSLFLEAMRELIQHQAKRGVRARTAVWSAMTGQTNSVMIAADFNGLDDFERFTELSATDSSFAEVRRAVRAHMIYDAANVSIQRLAFHSEGLMSAEESTAPRSFMRVLTGDVLPGKHRDFVVAISQSLEYQKRRGIDATTSVWTSMTGATAGIAIVAEFDSLAELQKFDDMAIRDGDFSRLRRNTRENMAFLTSEVQLLRNML